MKKIIYAILFVSLSVSSCFLWDGDEEKFKNAYKEICIAREMHEDSLKANEEVEKIWGKYGYTERSFFDEYMHYGQDREKFMIMLDSIREEAKREINMIKEKEAEEKKKAGKDSL